MHQCFLRKAMNCKLSGRNSLQLISAYRRWKHQKFKCSTAASDEICNYALGVYKRPYSPWHLCDWKPVHAYKPCWVIWNPLHHTKKSKALICPIALRKFNSIGQAVDNSFIKATSRSKFHVITNTANETASHTHTGGYFKVGVEE